MILVSPFKPKARALIKGRQKTLPYLEKTLTEATGPLLWVHASSIGEYEQGRPVIEKFKKQYPHYKVLVSFYSPSGYEAMQTDEVVNYKCYLPLDTRKNARKFLALVRPDVVMFVKYEFWHFYLDEVYKNDIPLFGISTIFRQSQVFFKGYGKFFRKMLKKFSFFYVQDDASQQLLHSLNINSLVTGDTRLDRVLALRDEEVSFPEIKEFCQDQRVFIIGSLRREDLELCKAFIRLNTTTKFIIAPHEINEEMMRPLEEEFTCSRYTQLDGKQVEGQILIIDTVGILAKIYRYGQFAYVGGGLSDGLHNILEPAVYELPVFFGNREYTRFKEALDLIGLGTAFAIGSAGEMNRHYHEISEDPEQHEQIVQRIKAYLELNKGASERIIDHLQGYLK